MDAHSHAIKVRDGTVIYAETHGRRSAPAIFLGPHFYPTRSGSDESSTVQWIEGLSREFFLITADYPRGIGRTPNPQGCAYDANTAVEEYGCIADALGVRDFGWFGYSFGGAMGVQMACRTNRVAALAIGGFPPLNAPFAALLQVSRHAACSPQAVPQHRDPGILWSAVGFYESLSSWAEREKVSRLAMPRLVFMGDKDSAQGCPQSIPLADALRAVERDLCDLGWDVEWLADHDHCSALDPAVSLPLIRRFFRQALHRN